MVVSIRYMSDEAAGMGGYSPMSAAKPHVLVG